jgi:hypothetical protein
MVLMVELVEQAEEEMVEQVLVDLEQFRMDKQILVAEEVQYIKRLAVLEEKE